MIEKLAAFFRRMNSRLVDENRYLAKKLTKGSYALSLLAYRLRLAKNRGFTVIHNFDTNLNLKLNTSWTMGYSIFWTGFHELRELVFLHRVLKPHMVFVDVGANMGEYTIFAAKRLTQGSVLAFEPLPEMVTLLNENIGLNGFSNVQVHAYGLSDKPGVLPFHELDERDGNEGVSTFYPGDNKVKGILNLALKTFDEEFESYGVSRVDFIKFDIEGGELPALRGARKIIEKFRPWIMVEISDQTTRAAGYRPQDIYEFFRALSYTSYEIVKDGELKPSAPVTGMKNIVFKPA